VVNNAKVKSETNKSAWHPKDWYEVYSIDESSILNLQSQLEEKLLK